MVSLRSLVLPAAVVLGLTGCAASTTAPDVAVSPGVADSPPAAAAPAQGAEGVGTSTLDASLMTLDGAPFDPATIEGRPVILWFWAPWCTICRSEAPDIAEVATELTAEGSDVVLLGVPGRGETPEMADFVADTGTGAITHVVDADGSLWRTYGVITQPAFALLSADGEVVDVLQGALGADGLRAAADELSEG